MPIWSVALGAINNPAVTLDKDFITMDKNVYSVYDQFFPLWLAFKGLIQ